jgi:hypothetical protein
MAEATAAQLADFNTFCKEVVATFTLAYKNGMGIDIMTEITAFTAAVAADGYNPAADLAAINSLNKVISDLITAKNQITVKS